MVNLVINNNTNGKMAGHRAKELICNINLGMIIYEAPVVTFVFSISGNDKEREINFG